MSTATPFDLYHDPLTQGVHAIEASAGTGKTYTLAQLVVRLVVEKRVPIERILVVTFTRAAAAELRERVFARLSEVLQALDKPVEDEGLQDWVNRLEDRNMARKAILQARLMLDQAPIYTIDAFAMQVAREHALALGLSWDAALLEEESRLDQQIVDQLWHEVDVLPAFVREVVLKRWPSPDTLFERIQQLGMYASFQPETSLDERLQQRAAILDRWSAERLQVLYEALRESVHGGWARSILTPLKMGRMPEVKLDTSLLDYLKSKLKKNASLDSMSEQQLSELSKLDEDLRAIPSLDDLAEAWFQDIYHAWQVQRRQHLTQRERFTYDSLKHQLADAVEAQPALRQTLQQGYQACLIDEFQDTDPDQWCLFSTLFGESDAHWLFLIGDPKQAIYSFRGANLLTYFEAVKTARFHHTLDTNYRSHPNLIEGFNQLFAELEGERAFLSEDCVYQTVNSGRRADELAFTLDGQSLSLIRVVTGEEISDKEEETLQQLARDVVRVLEAGRLQDEAVRPGHIAVLVKSNADALAVQKALRKVNVPAVLTSSTSVWHSDSAKALLHLLQAILNPRRRQHVRAVLAGPLFQRSLDDLNGEARYGADQIMLSAALQRWEREGVLTALLSLFQQAEIWSRLARLPDGDRRMADIRHLLELLHQQAHHHQLSPHALMRWAIRQHQSAASEDNTLRLEKDDDAVEIVTMHKAKGLEYPIVFVYGAWKGGRAERQSFPVAIAMPQGKRASFSKEDKDELVEQERQELRRLFYVACTRAVSHLTIYWPNADQEAAPKKGWPDALNGVVRSRLDLLRQSSVFRFDPYENDPLLHWAPTEPPHQLESPPPLDFAAFRQRARLLTSYSSLTRHMAVESPYARWTEEMEEDTPESSDPLSAGAAFGTFVHDCLEKLDFAQPDWRWLEDRWRSFARHGESTWPTLRKLFEQTLSGNCRPFSLKALPAHAVRKECHFVLRAPSMRVDRLNALFEGRADWSPVDGRVVQGYLQGYIDLIAEVDGRYYIVDYKTNRLPAYDEDALRQAMKEHHYTLQALIYTLALDAHLRAFKPDYDPSRHLGGVRYLFMRGMKPDSTEGVYAFQFERKQLDEARNILLGEHP